MSRLMAAKCIDALSEAGFLVKRQYGRSKYFIDPALDRLLTGAELTQEARSARGR